nr:hypothetical protein B1D4.220 [imported] - Neurospora crassa [Neurospora crassa]
MLDPGSRHATPQDEAVDDSQRRQRGNDNHGEKPNRRTVRIKNHSEPGKTGHQSHLDKHIVDHTLVSVYVACLTCNCWSCQMVLRLRDRGKEHGNGFPRGQEGRTLICLLFKQGTIPNLECPSISNALHYYYEKHPHHISSASVESLQCASAALVKADRAVHATSTGSLPHDTPKP